MGWDGMGWGLGRRDEIAEGRFNLKVEVRARGWRKEKTG